MFFMIVEEIGLMRCENGWEKFVGRMKRERESEIRYKFVKKNIIFYWNKRKVSIIFGGYCFRVWNMS